MSIRRKLAIAFAVLLFGTGLWILVYDLWIIHQFGFDYNDVIFTGGDEWGDWPTGERPPWTFIQLYAFSFPFLIVGTLILAIRPKPPCRVRIRFGTE